MKYVVYNSRSKTHKSVEELTALFGGEGVELKLTDCFDVNSYQELVDSLKEEDTLILSGGDGTLFHFINGVDCEKLTHTIYLHRAGNGNDFAADLDIREGDGLIELNPYLKNLPTVDLDFAGSTHTYKYINGVGYGIDGQVCATALELKAKGQEDINYTNIAISLVFGKYKRPRATVKVDGNVKEYKRVWLASAMNGRYYGGGMKVAPEQNRLSNEISCCVWHNQLRIPSLILFTKIFEGGHVKDKKHVEICKGHEIEVTFDRPTALQLDGETFLNVTHYVARKN